MKKQSLKKLFHRLFPCRFQESLCLNNELGCRCGKGRSRKRKEAEERALVPLRQVEEAAKPTPQEQQREKSVFDLETSLRPLLERRMGMVPEDLLRSTGGITSQLMDLIQSRLGRGGEELMGAGGPISERTLALTRQAVENPEQFFYGDVFKPNLELLRQSVAQQSARRGITPESGLTLENLGRTGLDLAIQDALQRQQARVLGLQTGGGISQYAQQLMEQARREAGGVSDVARGEAQGARGEMYDYLQRLQQLREMERDRALGGMQPRVLQQSQFGTQQAQRLGGPSPWIKPAAQAGGTILGSLVGQPMLGYQLGSMAGNVTTGGQSSQSSFPNSLSNLLYAQQSGQRRPSAGVRLTGDIGNYYPFNT